MSLARLGLPNALQQLLFAAGFVVLFWIVGQIGTPQLAIANVLVNITLVTVLPGMGFGLAAATLCAQALGRQQVEDARRWAWDVFRQAVLLLAPLAALMLLLPGPILAMFVKEPELIELGRLPLQLVGATVLADALGLILMNALLGVGAAALVMKIAVGLQWGLFLPLAWLLGPKLGLGLNAVWLAMLGYRGLQTGLFVHYWRRGGWATIKV